MEACSVGGSRQQLQQYRPTVRDKTGEAEHAGAADAVGLDQPQQFDLIQGLVKEVLVIVDDLHANHPAQEYRTGLHAHKHTHMGRRAKEVSPGHAKLDCQKEPFRGT